MPREMGAFPAIHGIQRSRPFLAVLCLWAGLTLAACDDDASGGSSAEGQASQQTSGPVFASGSGTDSVSVQDPSEPAFADPALAACVKAAGAPANAITSLTCTSGAVVRLAGIETLTALKTLELNGNEIEDLRPLAGLTTLVSLNLAANRVRDLTPLEQLAGLWELILAGNAIDDLGPLDGLTALTRLDLSANGIDDVRPLAYPTRLEYLKLDGNAINDVTSLESLTHLTFLNLSTNSISYGIAGLAALSRVSSILLLGNGDIPCMEVDALRDALGGSVVTGPSHCAP